MFDALVIGSGPSGLTIAAALCNQGLKVQGLAPMDPAAPWVNTYGIWCDELEALGLADLLEHRWQDAIAYFGSQALALKREYGLFDKDKFQAHLLHQCAQSNLGWHLGKAAKIAHRPTHSCITTQDGVELSARVVIDASGHQPVFVQKPRHPRLAYQSAYGIVGRFSVAPIQPGQFVLMDYRADHLSAPERREPPTFLYAMDLGDGVFFVEETSLAYHPAISLDVLKQRLYQRLEHRGVQVTEIHHVEHCLFPMNSPLPDFRQPVVGFGGATSMVHPASGYMVGALLRRAPAVAEAIARSLSNSAVPDLQDTLTGAPWISAGQPSAPAEWPANPTALAAWQALWPRERICKHYLYLFGLEKLMRFEADQLNHFFTTFFHLPLPQWSGFLADSMSLPDLLGAMLNLFGKAPTDVRLGLMMPEGAEAGLLWRAIRA